jgi:hypothetical protein
MSYLKKLNQIKLLLGMEVKMNEYLLEDGVTKIVCDGELVPGAEVKVISETGETAPAPMGTHTLQDGTVIEVDENSKVVSVEKPEENVEIEIEAQEEEVKVEEKVEEKLPIDKIEEMIYALASAVEKMAEEIKMVKEDMASYKSKTEKMSKTPGAKKISTYNTEAATDTVDAVELRLEALKNLRAEVKPLKFPKIK